MATPASGAITRCWPWPLAAVTCCSATASRTLFSSFSKPNFRSDFQWSARVTESPHELAVISQRVGFDNFQDTVQRPL